MKRKDIDNFLVELDKFIWEYKWIIPDIDLDTIFCMIFKIHKNTNKNTNSKSNIKLDNILSFVNYYSMTHNRISIKRKENFVRRVAYWIEYKEVHDFSYKEIFLKMCYNNWLFKDNFRVITNHWKDITKLPRLIIPQEWYHTNDFLINNL